MCFPFIATPQALATFRCFSKTEANFDLLEQHFTSKCT
jgi:hypothetical protein